MIQQEVVDVTPELFELGALAAPAGAVVEGRARFDLPSDRSPTPLDPVFVSMCHQLVLLDIAPGDLGAVGRSGSLYAFVVHLFRIVPGVPRSWTCPWAPERRPGR